MLFAIFLLKRFRTWTTQLCLTATKSIGAVIMFLFTRLSSFQCSISQRYCANKQFLLSRSQVCSHSLGSHFLRRKILCNSDAPIRSILSKEYVWWLTWTVKLTKINWGRVHFAPEEFANGVSPSRHLKMQQSPVILNLCLGKARSEENYNYRDVIVRKASFPKLRPH